MAEILCLPRLRPYHARPCNTGLILLLTERANMGKTGAASPFRALTKTTPAAMHHASHIIRAGLVIDGRGGPALRDRLLLIRSGRIMDIRPDPGTIQEHIAVTDFSDCVVMPPMIDCHVHLSLGERGQEGESGAERLWEYVRHGVLAVRDAGTARDEAFCPLTGGLPLQIKRSGAGIYRQGRYGRLFGHPLPPGQPPAASSALSQAGIAQVKVFNSGIVPLAGENEPFVPQFSEEELAQCAAHCHKKGLGLMVHANGEEPVRRALAAGCDSLEHGFFMGEENLRRLADTGITWIPTCVPMQALASPVLKLVGPQQRRRAARILEQQLGQIARARELGVNMALGTDAGSPGVAHGASAHRELALFIQAGLSPGEAVHCATAAGARLLGLAGSARIEPGEAANFLVLDGVPADPAKQAPAVRALFVKGLPWQERPGEEP